ncbi:ATP-binding protein [Caulobacter soli]|uniref:ATP-binding protein n=1 Tax=Caulobacter soli TaxID=2708539 RepID=UPI0013EA1B11|nr:ATP-binding protein [Caulobacter soli]
MIYAEAKALLTRMRSGQEPDALGGYDFQKLVFWAMVEQVLEFPDGCDLQEHPKGAIDIVVSERARPGPAFLPTEARLHYFECKHHSRPLELDTIAKTLVVGVRDQPLSLNLVSSTHLLPQAIDYAYALFSGDPQRQPMFRYPVFRHFVLGDLIADTWRGSTLVESRDVASPTAQVVWSISECRAFIEPVIYSSEEPPGTGIRLEAGILYRLSAVAATRRNDHLLDFAPAAAGCELTQVTRRSTATGLRFDALMRFAEPAIEANFGMFVILGGGGASLSAMPAVPLRVTTAGPGVQDDLRDEKTRTMVARLAGAATPRLLLVEGVAGVGKSYFCERLAANLRAFHGFDADRFTLEATGEASLLQRILVAIFTPPSARAHGGARIGAVLAEALVARAAGDDIVDASDAPETIIPILVRSLASLGDRLLILRDCHLVSEASAKWIWLLVTGLEDLGWGGIRLILESRADPAQDTPHWRTLRQRLAGHVKSMTVETLVPLGRAAFVEALTPRLRRADPPIVEALYRRTGGLPLLLTSHLAALTARNVVQTEDDGKLLIRASSAFLASSDLEISGQSILRKQLEQIDWRDTPRRLPDGLSTEAVVGLLGVLEQRAEPLLTDAIGLDAETIGQILAAMAAAGVVQVTSSGGWRFAHDLMRTAAVEAASASRDFRDLVGRLAEPASATPMLCEPLGDAAIAAGDTATARRLLNAAYEQAVLSEDFHGRLRITRKLATLYADEDPRGTADIETHLTILDALGWAEWTAGSLVEAREAYEAIATRSLALADWDIPLRESRYRASDGLRRSAGVSLEMADWSAFTTSVERFLDLGGSREGFTSLSNRLVQACARLDQPGASLDFARLSAPFVGQGAGENAAAVLLADTAHAYLDQAPFTALTMLEQAFDLAETPRQRAFARLDLLNAAFAAQGVFDESDAEALRREVLDKGYVTMRGRLDLLRACACLKSGDLTLARKLLDQADITVALYGQTYLEPALRNADLILALSKGDAAAVVAARQRAEAVATAWLEARTGIEKRIEGLLDAAARQAARFQAQAPSPIAFPHPAPARSGAFRSLVENLRLLKDGETATSVTQAAWQVDLAGLRLAAPPH